MAAYRQDPVLFVKQEFKTTPDSWQGDVLRAYPHNQRLAMSACVGPGKSAALVFISLNFLVTRPAPKIAATSITWENLRDNYWAELAKWIAKSELLSQMLEWQQTRVFFRAELVKTEERAQSWISARRWSKSADEETLGTTLAGLHSDYILALADEAGGMPPAITRRAEGILSSPIEGHLIVAGNPTHLAGALHECVVKRSDKYKVIRITGDPDDPNRAPRVNKEWAQELIDDYGRDSAYVRGIVLGLFPIQSTDAMIGLNHMEDAFKRYGHPFNDNGEALQRGLKVLGCDIARFGSDSTNLGLRDGDFLDDFIWWQGKDTMYSAAKIREIAIEEEVNWIAVDDVGVGGGVTDKLIEFKRDGLLDCGIVPINAAETSSVKDRMGQPRFANKKAEHNIRLAEQHFFKGNIAINPKIETATSELREGSTW